MGKQMASGSKLKFGKKTIIYLNRENERLKAGLFKTSDVCEKSQNALPSCLTDPNCAPQQSKAPLVSCDECRRFPF
jgi:hypothetical protein